MKLDLIVFESDPKKTKLITLRVFRELVALGIPEIGSPIAVVPVGLLTTSFKIVTYPPMVKEVARYAERNGLKFNKVYGIVQTKLFDILPDAESWLDLSTLLTDIGMVGRWLNWGLNFIVLDKHEIMMYIEGNKNVFKLLNLADIEDALRNLSNLKVANG